MPKSSANRTSLWRALEGTWGADIPSPEFKETRYTGEGLDDSLETATSQEIRRDRMTSDVAVVDSSPGGDFQIELSFDAYDDLLQALMMSEWSTPLAIESVAGDIEADATANKLISTTANKFEDVQVGQWIRVQGFANEGNNGLFRVAAKDASNLELTLQQALAADESAAGEAVKISGSMIRNGVEERSFTLLKRFEDLTPVVNHLFRGMRVSQFTVDLQSGSLVTGAFSFMGKNADMTEGDIAGATYADAPTFPTMNAVSNVAAVHQGDGAALEGSFANLSLSVNNNHREQKGIGVLGNVGVVAGRLEVTASFSQYFETRAEYLKFKNATAFMLAFTLQDNEGNAYVFTIPAAKYTSMVANAGGLDSDVMLEGELTAIRDPLTNCMFQIDKFSADA